jgi:cytochrome P450
LAHIAGPGRNTWDEQSPVKEVRFLNSHGFFSTSRQLIASQLSFIWNIAALTEESNYWEGPEHIAQALLGVWFAAAHQPWMNLDFIMLQLCRRPEIQEALREEIGTLEGLTYENLMSFPLLDSFIKETVRLHPLDTMAVRRKALRPYTFASGAPHVPAGATVCVSSYNLMHNDIDYPFPNEFRLRRFIDTESSVRGSSFTEVSEKFPVWGYGSLAW